MIVISKQLQFHTFLLAFDVNEINLKKEHCDNTDTKFKMFHLRNNYEQN